MCNRRRKIRFLSILFIFFSAAIIISLIIPIMSLKKSVFNDNLKINEKNREFTKVSFKTYDAKGKEINLKSDKVFEKDDNSFTFQNMISTFPLSNGEMATISANTTNAIRGNKTECEFVGNVKLTTESGLLMETEKSFVDFDKKIATGDSDIVITLEDTKVSSQKYLFDMNKNVLTLISRAKGYLKSDKVSADKIIIYFENGYGKTIKSLEAIGKANYISVNYNLRASKNILYCVDMVDANENVVLFYKKDGKDYDIRSDSMRAFINKYGVIHEVIANGSLIIKTKDARIRAKNGVFKNDKIIVRNNVAISGSQGDVFGDTAELDINTGNIVINNSSGIVNDRKPKQ